jgi:hypothetical protein
MLRLAIIFFGRMKRKTLLFRKKFIFLELNQKKKLNGMKGCEIVIFTLLTITFVCKE